MGKQVRFELPPVVYEVPKSNEDRICIYRLNKIRFTCRILAFDKIFKEVVRYAHIQNDENTDGDDNDFIVFSDS
ncbi:hypothetical protein HgNV_045 [Homarus gammarus nudivirus]|uniref:Uncharacterized protein n=1 Tax=Homarus gammarus nudivirus TaxID=2509616 RepID=A0A411HB60_9VIRU|nr:hypothetical protein KM727_gp45 [Homarus gammarus nudivirus]QBB28650.1 hypothetical protein HgNV_045 [Homarus gammarus nudivirus]